MAQRRQVAVTAVPGMESLAAWLAGRAWPLWLEHGIDRQRRAFHEYLALDGSGCAAPFRRLRVAARQVYVFAQARLAGLPGAGEALGLGVEFLLGTARQPDGGYAWRFDLDNRVIDDRRDLYDHAFVLLALAAAHQAEPDRALHAAARQLEDYLEARFRHPAGGYRESLPDALPRRQNPHMHLLEALLAAAEAFGDERFLVRANGVVELLLHRLLDRASLTLPEWFDENLCAQRADGRHVVEPGHLCEWIWLLHEYQRMAPGHADADLAPVRAGFAAFVARHGSLPGRADLMDEVWSDGTPSQSASRLWPQAERLKAACLAPVGTAPDRAAAVLRDWLRHDGLWHERRTADGAWSQDPAPASSLYHLTCAILFAGRQGTPAVTPGG